MAPTIRPMQLEDFPQVYKLGLSCYNVQDKPYNYWTIGEVADHFQNHLNLCYVADSEGQIVGFALGADSYEVMENTGHLEWVAVAPEYRRQGVASQLMQRLVEIYRQLGKAKVVSDISSANVASRGMARKLGFTEGISVTFFVKNLTD
ncbi:MAG: GNAT family N-acetyltransferase [Chloroflexota bacterium]|nr:GNAT family N-acetyltransferase [Chloroflexota bacterium]MDQ5866225.1 GNAT family N-acetyltransferase [Chloroflexota bacterium]